ncbi:MAG: hypothetical protein UT69_C0038G0004 [Candidatus Yanofskybacteria bacterium GW2011_GWE1_40_10]|nr:MAG: hypothetical protein UT69_C0038G0004 [Candidatus Yanofskybacteria bacterium GW2011_GWE1_40_10]
MSYKNLILRYQLPLSELTPEDEYWLIIEQVVEDERATVGFVADTIDALFDTTLCVESQDEEPALPEEPVTPDSFEDMDEVIDKIAEKTEVDMSACEILRSGTYQTDLKIIRSHPDIPYALRLSVGKIIKTVLSSEQVSVNQNVKNQSFTILPFPVQTGLRVSWLGQVIGKNGVITPPAIQALGNTLFWGVEATGSLRAEFGTLYDLVTVEIPGIPNYVGSELGESQSADVLAFYHYHVYRADINPPEVDDGLFEEVCGYSTSTGVSPDEDPEPEPPPEPVIQYGCIDYFPLAPFGSPVTEPWFFREKCCVDGQHDGCRVRSSRLEGGKKLSDEIINRMTLEWPGPIEFIGLGPITPAGCGTRYEETVIRPQNCCEDATPIVWDSDNSVEVLADNTSGIVAVTGGVPPYHWSVRGQGFALNAQGNLRDGFTDTPYVRIYATHLACGFASIEVTDGCSVVNGGVRSTNGEWVQIGWPNDLLSCAINGDQGDYIGQSEGWSFEKIAERYWLIENISASFGFAYGGPLCGASEPYIYDPARADHQSCFSGFNTIMEPGSTLVNDRCFWIFVSGGYRTWYAEHNKYLYEWRC